MDRKTIERQQRLKSEEKWPSWLRDPRLLKWAIQIGKLIYRLWWIYNALTGDPDS